MSATPTPGDRRRRVRVLVADDSSTSREVVVALLQADPRVEVVGTAADGLEAVERAQALRPDVITMDVSMPRLDGLEATRRIMREAPSRIVVVCAVARERAVELGFLAMDAGALEVVAKPAPGEDARAWGRRLLEAVLLMSEVPVVRRWGATTPASGGARRPLAGHGVVDAPRDPRRQVDVVGIAASTGGPPALAALLGALPASFPAPVLVAQHIARGFDAGLARWLDGCTPLEVALAREGEACLPGRVLVAPADLDLEVDPEGLTRLRPSRGGPCPSGDRLLESLARAWGARAAGVVLTGMGEDGARGLAAIRAAGGRTLAQDERSCVVYGMPRAAVELGAVEASHEPARLGRLLTEAVASRGSGDGE